MARKMFPVASAKLLVVWACCVALAHAEPRFSDMYVIGDSLSDTGNLTVFAPSIQPDWVPPLYYRDGRATNGRVAVEVLAERLHADGILNNPQVLPSEFLLHSIGNTNYAVGGAHAAGEGPVDLGAQVTALVASQPGFSSDVLAIVFIGGNDILSALATGDTSVASTQIGNAVDSELEAIRTLVYAGIKNVLAVEVVDLGRVPHVPLSLAQEATEVSVLYNRLLADEIALLRANTDAFIAIYPLFTRFTSAIITQFPEQNWRIACLSSGVCVDGQGNVSESVSAYVFLDSIHPTARVHELMGADMANYVAGTFPSPSGEVIGNPGESGSGGAGEGGTMSGGGGGDTLFVILLALLCCRHIAVPSARSDNRRMLTGTNKNDGFGALVGDKFLKVFLALFILAAASCTGEGPGSGALPGEFTLGGAAAKGVLWKGNVQAEELDSYGSVVRVIGSAVTDQEGRYSISLGNDYTGGPIRMVLSAGPETLMRCDAPIYTSMTCGRHTGQNDANINGLIDRGEWFSPGDFSMSALLPQAASGERISISITPFTDLAASRAMESGQLSAEAITSANHELTYLLGGLNITHTPVIDVTDQTAVGAVSSDSLYYSALSAGTISLAGIEPSTGLPNLTGMLDRLGGSLQGGRLPALPGITPGATSLTEILEAAERQFDALGRTDMSGMMSLAYSLASDSIDGYVYAPSASGLPLGGVARVKDLVRDIRNWGGINAEGYRLSTSLESKARISQQMIEKVSGELSTVLYAAVMAMADSDFQNVDLGTLKLPRIAEAKGTISADSNNARLVLTGILTPWSNKQPYNISLELLFKSFSEVEITGAIRGNSEELDIQSSRIFFTQHTVDGVRLLQDSALHLNVVLRQTALVNATPVDLIYTGKFLSTLRAVDSTVATDIASRTYLPTSLKLDGHFSLPRGQEFNAVLAVDLNAIDPVAIMGNSYSGQELIASASIEEQLYGSTPSWITLHGSLQSLSEQPSSLSISNKGCPLNLEVVSGIGKKYQLIFSNCFGATLTVLMPDGTGEAIYNDKLYGTITNTRNMLKINYIDGSFETIF